MTLIMANAKTLLKRVAVALPQAETDSDRDLLRRYASEKDEYAFEMLARRYAGMVFAVCRRIVTTREDAEDATQAVFLLLARKAASVSWRDSVANWLYSTARKLAANARIAEERRRNREARSTAKEPSSEHPAATRELQAVVDEELGRLPPRYREALMLCYHEGLSCEAAADRLGVPIGTLKTRIARGRKRLDEALAGRGCSPGIGLVLLAVGDTASAAPPELVHSILAAAPSAAAKRLMQGYAMEQFVRKSLFAGAVAAVVIALAAGSSESRVEGLQPAAAPPAEAKAAAPEPKAEPAPIKPGNWPLFRGDALMSGVGHAKLPDQLDERWTFKTGDTIEGAPAIHEGTVYVGSFDKHFYAIDLATGRQKWKLKLGHVKASPSVKGDKVYVGNLNGDFFCLAAADGKQLWKFETGGEISSGCNFHGENILIGSHDSTLYCLDRDGKKLWSVMTDGPVNGSPVVVGDTTFVAGCDSVLHVLDAKTGKELGTVDLGGQAAATAAVKGDFAYVGTMTNNVVAIDWKNKKKAWSFEAAQRSQPFYASAAVTDGLVIAGSRDNRLYALDRATGKEVWSFEAEGMIDGSPVVVGNRVYTGCLSKDGNFYVLDLKTGKKLQELELDAAIPGSLSVGPDCILVGTDKGTLYCLGTKAK